jgi:hypothetical protein
MQVGLDKLTSVNCEASLGFRQDKQYSTLVLTSLKYFQSADVRANVFQIPQQRKALFVTCKAKIQTVIDNNTLKIVK